MKRHLIWFAAAQVAIVLGGGAILQPSMTGSASAHDAETVKQIFAKQLPNVPGNSMTAFVVEYEPGGKGASHHHSGSVFAYKAGEFFYEPPGSDHLVSENASATKPAKLLAVFVASDDAVLTAPGVNN